MTVNENCAKKLKLLREAHNYSQEYVASALDITQNGYSLIEKGATKITLDRLEILANFYKLEIIELIGTSELSFQVTSNGNHNHSNFPPALSQFEKKMYEQNINRMEIEIDRLFKLLLQLTSQISVSAYIKPEIEENLYKNES